MKIGEQTLTLNADIEFKVMSDKFVNLFIDRIITEWETTRRKQRQEMRNSARIEALDQPDAWIPGNGMDLNELNGEQVDVRGKGKGTVKSAKSNQLMVLFEKDVKAAMKMSMDGDLEPTMVDPMKVKFRAKDPQFVRMYVNKLMKEGLMKEAQEKIDEWRKIDGPEDTEEKLST